MLAVSAVRKSPWQYEVGLFEKKNTQKYCKDFLLQTRVGPR
jgi:hypothetical protein